jgi:hypothetical protein
LVELVIAGKDAEAQLSTLREELKALNNLQPGDSNMNKTLDRCKTPMVKTVVRPLQVLKFYWQHRLVILWLCLCQTETLDHPDQPPPTAPPTTTTSDALPSQSAAETKNGKTIFAGQRVGRKGHHWVVD